MISINEYLLSKKQQKYENSPLEKFQNLIYGVKPEYYNELCHVIKVNQDREETIRVMVDIFVEIIKSGYALCHWKQNSKPTNMFLDKNEQPYPIKGNKIFNIFKRRDYIKAELINEPKGEYYSMQFAYNDFRSYYSANNKSGPLFISNYWTDHLIVSPLYDVKDRQLNDKDMQEILKDMEEIL